MKFFMMLLVSFICQQSFANMNMQQKKYQLDFTKELNFTLEINFRDALDASIDNRFELSFINNKTQEKFIPKFYVGPYLWMIMPNGHEHGSSPIMLENIDHVEKKYYFYNVFFVMPGKWQFHVRLEDQDCKYFDTNYDQNKKVCYLDKTIELTVPGQGMGMGHGKH